MRQGVDYPLFQSCAIRFPKGTSKKYFGSSLEAESAKGRGGQPQSAKAPGSLLRRRGEGGLRP